MVIKEVHYQPAYHYELQTYVEKRETNWTYAPHKGGSINGPSHGRAPLPWEIVEDPTSMFKDEVRIVSIPHTDVIKACHKCRGTGGMTCRECSGKVRISFLVLPEISTSMEWTLWGSKQQQFFLKMKII